MSDEAHFLRGYTAAREARTGGLPFDELWELAKDRLAIRYPMITRAALAAQFGDGPVSRRSWFETIVALDRDLGGKARAGAKVPLYIRIDELLAWHPDARIVAIVRDPRATIASTRRMRWVAGWSISRLADAWRQASSRGLRPFAAHPQVHIVRYEDLVADWPAAMSRICGFLGEEPEARMLAPAIADLRFNTSGDRGERATAVVQGRNERWRSSLTKRETWTIEAICAQGMQRYGYPPTVYGRSRLRDTWGKVALAVERRRARRTAPRRARRANAE